MENPLMRLLFETIPGRRAQTALAQNLRAAGAPLDQATLVISR